MYTDQITPDLQIEFCKSKACADHWAEEVELLQEEMKQVKQFFLTCAEQWEAQATAVGTLCVSDPSIAEGLHAFASEQAAQYHAICAHCKHLWRYVAEYIALGVGDVVPSEAQTVDDDMAVVASE
jgi:hypothetical protein